MNARDAILARLRRAPAAAAAPLPDIAAWYAAPAQPPQALCARFRANIEAARAEVHETDEAGWPALLVELMARKRLRTLLVGRGGLSDRVRATPHAGLEIVGYDRPITQWRDRLFETIDAALTTAHSAIAATGSLVLRPDPREPRLMSLVPPVHFVLLHTDAIHADLHAAMTAEHWAAGMPTNVVIVSGPSKTADIQQTLAYGAHGPRELVVLLCHPAGGSA